MVVMKGYAGTYQNRGRFVLTVDNGVLTPRQNDGPPLQVTKVGANRFVAVGPNNRPRLRLLLAEAREDRPAYLTSRSGASGRFHEARNR